jgi:hypothetical protein
MQDLTITKGKAFPPQQLLDNKVGLKGQEL